MAVNSAKTDRSFCFCGVHVQCRKATLKTEICKIIYEASLFRGTQRIVSVNYLFGRPLIPDDFLKGIFTLNFRDMGNLRTSVFKLIKMSFWAPKNGQLRFLERK